MCIMAEGVEGYYVAFKAMYRDGVSDAFPFFLLLALFITNRISWSIIFILNLFCRVPKGRHLEFCRHRKYIGTKAQQSHEWWWKWELWNTNKSACQTCLCTIFSNRGGQHQDNLNSLNSFTGFQEGSFRVFRFLSTSDEIFYLKQTISHKRLSTTLWLKIWFH